MNSEWPGVDGGGVVAPSMGGTSQQGVGVVPRWWNPLDSAAIDARIAAGGFWAWRAQANDNVTWGAGPANYAASRISVEGSASVLGEIGGGPPNWAAATGWSGFQALNRALDTLIVPTTDSTWISIVQFANAAGNTYLYGLWEVIPGPDAVLACLNRVTGGSVNSYNGTSAAVAVNPPAFVTGNYVIAALQPYRNGIAEPVLIPVGAAIATTSVFIGARNTGGVPIIPTPASIQAFVLCDDATAFAAPDITAIAAAPGGSMHNL